MLNKNYIISNYFIIKNFLLKHYRFCFSSETSYIIGTDSLRSWRRLAMETFLEGIEQEMDDGQYTPSHEESKSVDKDGNDCPKEAIEENEENEAIINFNEDLLCEHNSLKTADSSRRVIPQEAWTILRKYFPDSKEYAIQSPSCSICEVGKLYLWLLYVKWIERKILFCKILII